MYPRIKPWLFRFEAEKIHDLMMNALEFTGQHPGMLRLMDAVCQGDNDGLNVRCLGLDFLNPIGLAAGFDKNARAIPSWLAMGFGFVEAGSVTALAQLGNLKPRLFRLPDDEAIINRMGFNNEGAARVAQRLAELEKTPWFKQQGHPVGINIGKSKIVALDRADEDYEHAFKQLWAYGDYFVINVSSPNTPGLRSLQNKDALEHLLTTLRTFTQQQTQDKPLLIKIAPDLELSQIDDILALSKQFSLSGLIATNTTIARHGLVSKSEESGGLSGQPLGSTSLHILKYIRSRIGASLPIISVGGITTTEDVYERFQAGANLVQLYTSLVYQGPFLLKTLKRGLKQKLKADGFSSLQEMIDKRDEALS